MAKNKKRRLLGFFKDIKGELKKVTWPSFKQVRNNTLIVIVCVLIIGAFIWILDGIFGFSFNKIIEKANEPAATEQQDSKAGTTTQDWNNLNPVPDGIPETPASEEPGTETSGNENEGTEPTAPETQNEESVETNTTTEETSETSNNGEGSENTTAQ